MGIGRSALIAACLLKSQGIGVDDAFAMISPGAFLFPIPKNSGNGWKRSLDRRAERVESSHSGENGLVRGLAASFEVPTGFCRVSFEV